MSRSEDSFDYGLEEGVQNLIDDGFLEPGRPSYGIALQAADQGVSSLSPAQRKVWDDVVTPKFEQWEQSAQIQLALQND